MTSRRGLVWFALGLLAVGCTATPPPPSPSPTSGPNDPGGEARTALRSQRATACDPEETTAPSALAASVSHLDDRPGPSGRFRQEPGAEPQPGDSSLYGRVLPPDASQSFGGVRLHLVGLPGSPTEDQHHIVETDTLGLFEFTGVLAGEYTLTDSLAGRPTWKTMIRLEPRQARQVDLTPGNSLERPAASAGAARS